MSGRIHLKVVRLGQAKLNGALKFALRQPPGSGIPSGYLIAARQIEGVRSSAMKTLFLIRHAKSSWPDPALPDKDRPLGDRGRRDARKMGKRLAKRDVKPDLILSSPARRALKTARIIAKKLDYKRKDIVAADRL